MDQANRFVVTFETGRHYQVHKSYVYVAPLVAVVAAIFLTLVNGARGWIDLAMAVRNGDINMSPLLILGFAVLGVVVLVGIFVLLYWLAWRNMSYVFDEREFSFYSGIITKRRVHVPYARVQSVNHRASIIQRIFGVCTVVIDSAGGASNKGVRVPYLRLETAERMRVDLFVRKAAVAAGAEAAVEYLAHVDTGSEEGAQAEAARVAHERSQPPVAPISAASASWTCPQCGAENTAKFCSACGTQAPAVEAPAVAHSNALDATMGVVGDWRGVYGGAAMFGEEPVSCEYGLTNHELLLTTISHDTPIGVALVVGLSFIVTLALVILVQDEVAVTIAKHAWPIVVVPTVGAWLIGLLTVMFSYGNFRARRRGTRIEVERGLLTRVSSGIDIARVQSIEVRQSFIRRLIGYCEISLGRIDTAGEQNKGNNNSKANTKGLVIHPFVKIDRVDEIVDSLAPEFSDRPRRVERKPVPKVAMRRAILRYCVWYNWALWIAVFIGVCWGAISLLANAGTISFASASSYDLYEKFMTSSLLIVIALFAVVTVARAVSAVLWAKHSGYIWNNHYLLLWNDGLSTAESVIPRQKVQAAATRSNPFQRRLSLVTLQAVTAAGTRNTTARLIDVPAEVGAAYLDWAKPRR